MAKAVKREKKHFFDRDNVFAALWGLVLLNIGGMLLFVLFNFSSLLYVPYNVSLQDVTETGQLQPELLRIMNANSLYGVSLVVLLVLQALLYGFTGWFVSSQAKNKAWYFATMPLLLVLLGSLISFLVGDVSYPNFVLVPMGYLIWLVSMMAYQMGVFHSIILSMVVFGIVGCGLLVLFITLGGSAARRVKLK